jgi:hypothetical protein
MKIKVPDVDARSDKGSYDVVDAHSNLIVGFLECGLGVTGPAPNYERMPSRAISLFDGKYWGRYESTRECQAFADGVASVLRHLVSQSETRFVEQEPPATILNRRV